MKNRPTLLLVDDEIGILKSLEMILKDSYDLKVAQKGGEAIAILQNQPIDLILSDIHMPDMTGIEVLKRSKELDSSREVVMITGYANVETAKAALRLGAMDYISKPFDASHIQELVRSGLKKRAKAQMALSQLENLNKEKEELENHLLKTEKHASLGELTLGVVHEMNNPLTVIQGYVDLLLKKFNKNEKPTQEVNKEYKKYLQTVEHQIHQCREIAIDFLNFVRGSEGTKQSLDIKLMLEELVQMYRAHSLANSVEMKVLCDPDIPELDLNVGLIRQVFVNLIVNALHAMPSGGKLQVHIRRHPKGVEVCFQDSGLGISQENLDKIFDTFFTTKDGGKGSGLGLSISKKIVERHGGKISVTSQLGKGTTFALFFPSQIPANQKQKIA